MSADGFLRFKKLKGSGIVLAASRHNKRAIQSEHGAAGQIDPKRIEQNKAIKGPDTPEAVARLAKDQMAKAKVKPREKAVLAIEAIFSLPSQFPIDTEAFFQDCLKWIESQFGGAENILSADIHLDESAPHMHVLILPLVNGRMNGSDLVGNRHRLRSLQDSFHASVAGRYGLKKAPPRLQGQVKEKTAHAVIQRLRATNDTAQSSALWPVIRDGIDREPAKFALALGVEIAKPDSKRLRTMAQIFTSKGKGSSKEPSPIGFASIHKPIGKANIEPQESPSLCTVGQAPQLPSEGERLAEPERVVDRQDCDFRGWEEEGQVEPAGWD